ncbi:globin isoform X1 [Anoplophora glabripennis]|uniref:globin isoform X1 n=2 Tax=Anoplophora glabripennis TaxID=217634 RepID=UPI0008752314|nr:globin isoform X1 [Anoplophora glabripennis]
MNITAILYRDISSRAMGVLWSYLGYGTQGRTDDPDPVTGLTSRDRYLIKSSWAGPRQKPTESGVALFLLFFKHHPEYKLTFPFRDISDEDLPTNKRFHAHANSVIYAFSSVVDAIDDPDMLVTILSRVGESHGPRKITEKSFFDLKDTLIELFSSLFTKEEMEAWKKALDVAIELIAKSFRESRK